MASYSASSSSPAPPGNRRFIQAHGRSDEWGGDGSRCRAANNTKAQADQTSGEATVPDAVPLTMQGELEERAFNQWMSVA